jgi:predicted lipoprotein with Yx(FWY)xxD motif
MSKTIDTARKWTCDRCGVSSSRIDGARTPLPESWARSADGLFCLTCRRERAAERALDAAPAGGARAWSSSRCAAPQIAPTTRSPAPAIPLSQPSLPPAAPSTGPEPSRTSLRTPGDRAASLRPHESRRQTVTRTFPAIAILAIGALLAVSGCGGGSDGSNSGEGGAYGSGGGESSATQNASGEASGGDGVVAVAKNPDLGTILVDSKGFTLYDFHKDKGTKSTCYGACAGTWPPLTTSGAARAMGGAEKSKLGTTERSDGTMQVTYAGHPLYTYAADRKPGEANGNDIDSFGAEWYALQPSGEEPKD